MTVSPVASRAHLEERIDRLEALLVRCRDQFAFYASQHAAKEPPQLEKAAVNTAFVEEINLELGMVGNSDVFAPLLRDVYEFHEVFAPDWLPAASVPLPLSYPEAKTRAKWIASETNELLNDTVNAGAVRLGSDPMFDLIAKQADAFLDAIYFSLGGLVRMKLNVSPLWAIIHGQNMAKRNADGTVTRRESDGKVMKPEGWVDPHELLVAEIKRQADAA